MIAYRDKDTAIHRFSAAPKLAWVISIVALSLVFDNPLYLGLLFLSTLPLVAAAHVWRAWASYMKVALVLGLLLVFINVLINYNGSHVLARATFSVPGLGHPQITLEALISGLGNTLRLFATISAFSILTLTVHPDDLMQVAFKLKLPQKSVLVTSMSARFVPVLAADAQRIADVQSSRGLELARGGLRQKARNRMAVILPLLANSLDRSLQVAEAMEARAYGSGKGRTSLKSLKVDAFEIAALGFSIAALATGAFMRFLGQGAFRYFPALSGPALDGPAVLLLVLMLLIMGSIWPLALLKKRFALD